MPFVSPGTTSPSIYQAISAASTNEDLVQEGLTELRGYIFTNQHATAWAFLKLFNIDVAPTAGDDVPVMTLGLPPGGAGHISLLDENGQGITFGTGLGVAITADEALDDATAIGAGDVVLNLLYA